jgi:hypothetical protein
MSPLRNYTKLDREKLSIIYMIEDAKYASFVLFLIGVTVMNIIICIGTLLIIKFI